MYDLFNKLWWDQVMEIPDDKRIVVFKRGILKGLIIEILVGGQIIPISTSGDNLMWK